MALSKWKIKNTGIEFSYCNKTNRLFEADGSLMMFPPEWNHHYDHQEVEQTSKKTNNPYALRITLGHACNYDCSYCFQKDIGNPSERPQNKSLDTFIQNLKDNLDLSELRRVELWGGEPFLYWNDIVPIMKFLDRPGLTFYISTNGSTLHDKHVEFFNQLESLVTIGISHDGPAQKEQRGEEIFDIERVKRVLKKIDDSYPHMRVGFNSVVTRQNYDLFKMNTFFKKVVEDLDLNHIVVGFNIARSYKEVIEVDHHYSFDDEAVLSGRELIEFNSILKKYLEEQKHQYVEHNEKVNSGIESKYGCRDSNLIPSHYFTSSGGNSVIGFLKSLIHSIPLAGHTNCGSDNAKILSLDIEGNVRTCPHTGPKYIGGKLTKLEDARAINLNFARKTGHCDTCPNLKLCKSSCPIDLPKEVFLLNCGVEKIWYHQIQKTALSILFNSDVELLSSLYGPYGEYDHAYEPVSKSMFPNQLSKEVLDELIG